MAITDEECPPPCGNPGRLQVYGRKVAYAISTANYGKVATVTGTTVLPVTVAGGLAHTCH